MEDDIKAILKKIKICKTAMIILLVLIIALQIISMIRPRHEDITEKAIPIVDPANYSEEIGKEICLKRIEDKIWMLLGFELASRLNGSALD